MAFHADAVAIYADHVKSTLCEQQVRGEHLDLLARQSILWSDWNA